jgi:lipopolysaccharide export system protein LptC
MTADRIRIWFLVALTGLVMLASFWVYEVMRRDGEKLAGSARDRSEPDYYVEHFNFVRLSQSGQTNYRITGNKLTHFPKEDEFEILQPRIVGIDQEKTPMNIRADLAIIKQKIQENSTSKAEDEIHLKGNVILERTKTAKNEPLQIETTSLILFPDSERMKTSEAVLMKKPGAKITAVGLEANNIKQTINFLSEFRMEIERQNASVLSNATNVASNTKPKIALNK